MPTDTINVSFTCKRCGGHILELPDNPTDDSVAKCKSCGIEFGRYGEIKAKAKELVAKKVRDDLKSAFKGLEGWTITSN